jgi:uncharacterized protein YdeI (YjbR/CyaY-like superfamily)
MTMLRKILRGFELTEEFKWGKPCYAHNGGNVVVTLALKNYLTLLFCKGALLKDPKGLLVKAGEHTQAARQLRVTSAEEIAKKESVIKAYIKEAIAAEKAGLEVKFKTISEHTAPAELQKKLDENPALNKAFKALTPGRQRAYYIFISGAKQSATREARIAKCAPLILQGKGLNDR